MSEAATSHSSKAIYSTVALVPHISTMMYGVVKRSDNLKGPLKRKMVVLEGATKIYHCGLVRRGISVLNYRLSWSKFLNTHSSHSRQLFNIYILSPPLLNIGCTKNTGINMHVYKRSL